MSENERDNNEKESGKYSGADLNYIFGEGKINDSQKENGDGEKLYDIKVNNQSKFSQNDYFSPQPAPQYKAKNNYVKVIISIFVAVMMFTAGFLVAYSAVPSEEEKLARWIKSVADRNFYDADGFGYSFIDGIGNGMADSLDSYSRFYFGENLDRLLEENEGVFNDTGMVLLQPEGESRVRVVKVYGESPSYKSGIKTGDLLDSIIYKQNETAEPLETVVSDWSIQQIREKIAGLQKQGGVITFKFTRNLKDGQTENVTFVYKTEEYSPVFSYYSDGGDMQGTGISADTAYITLEEFSKNADEQFKANLQKFRQYNKRNLILDLRTNFGGGLDILQSVAAHLITDDMGGGNVKIMEAEYKNGRRKQYYTLNNYYQNYNFDKIIVLANEYSASATEVLISAMKDYGTLDCIIGAKTFGKAVMQQYFSYKSTYGIYMTVAKIYSPVTNVSYNKEGFTPDISVTYIPAGEFAADVQLLAAIDYINNPPLQA